MTAVVGILNKRGVAIAADSAVTRTRGRQEKVTKNGNKMVRLSNSHPISVMLTGNACFLRTPWDVIIRRYRQIRGDVEHPTVKDCAEDFFRYISENKVFWDKNAEQEWIDEIIDTLFSMINNSLPWDVSRRDEEGSLLKPKAFQNAFLKQLKKERDEELKGGICPQFKDYDFSQFKDYVKENIERYLKEHSNQEGWHSEDQYPPEMLQEIRDEFEQTLYARFTTRFEYDSSAVLVFSGFGSQEKYPSLISAMVCEGIDCRVNYHIKNDDVICISDERPVAI